MMDDERYLAARTVSDVWICYPWEATYTHMASVHKSVRSNMIASDIDEHDRLAASQANY